MEATRHPLTTVIDVLHRDPENKCCIPQLLNALLDVCDALPRKYTKSVPITSMFAAPGSLVRFRCEVRSVVRSRIAACSGCKDGLLLFRAESISKEEEESRKIDAISLGCVIRDPDTKILTPVIVKIFDDNQNIREGQVIKVVGILTYIPSFGELINYRRNDRISDMLGHDESNPNPLGARRVHAIYVDIVASKLKHIWGHADDEDGLLSENKTWCVLQ